ncbi:MAG TPA: hypothetical protein VN514_09660 [Ignavibacteria bacterium]|nr:hypothetical protein [Ignavibacteria bacterium]
MNNDTVREIDRMFVIRRTRILGIAILVGVFLVYIFGVFLPTDNTNPEYAYLNHISFVFCAALCTGSLFLKKILIKKVDDKNFAAQYFNAHVLPFALCDLGGLICITANLFINLNIVYASAGFLFAAVMIVLNFPRSGEINVRNKIS